MDDVLPLRLVTNTHLELVQLPLQAVSTECQEETHPLIKKNLKTSLQQISREHPSFADSKMRTRR